MTWGSHHGELQQRVDVQRIERSGRCCGMGAMVKRYYSPEPARRGKPRPGRPRTHLAETSIKTATLQFFPSDPAVRSASLPDAGRPKGAAKRWARKSDLHPL